MVVLYSDCSQDKVFCLSDYNHFSLVTISWVYTYMNEYEREGGDEIRYILLIVLVAAAVVSDISEFKYLINGIWVQDDIKNIRKKKYKQE